MTQIVRTDYTHRTK